MRGVLAGTALAALAVAGCSSGTPAPSGSGDLAGLSGSLKASGASFPNAFYQSAIEEFTNVAPDLEVTYNSVGSGTGKKEFGSGLTDFAGTDSTVKGTDGIAAGSFLYVPTVAAPITISYHLTGVDNLRLSPQTIAAIFQRDIRNWNDSAIAADNPGANLPDRAITVVHRSDGSGTTSNFTRYLAAAAPSWRLGSGDAVAWPADTQGGEKNTGVAQLVQASEGGIGYVDFADAKASGLTFASVKNKDGQFVAPTLDGATAALAGARVNDDLTYDPLNASGASSYPITAPTYLLLRTNYDPTKAKLVKGFVRWLLTDGQALAAGEEFAKLPANLQQKALEQLDKIAG